DAPVAWGAPRGRGGVVGPPGPRVSRVGRSQGDRVTTRDRASGAHLPPGRWPPLQQIPGAPPLRTHTLQGGRPAPVTRCRLRTWSSISASSGRDLGGTTPPSGPHN